MRAAGRSGLPVFVPPLSLSTDNAAMIGAAALRLSSAAAGRDYGLPIRWGSMRRHCVCSGVGLTRLTRSSQMMTIHTDYLWFNTKTRQEFVRITDEVAAGGEEERREGGMVLVSAMHITAGVYVNDWEDGLIRISRCGSRSWRHPGCRTASPDRRGQRRRAPEADHHGPPGHGADHRWALDLGPWEQIFYAEFDGQRKKRVVVKVMGE